MRLFEKLNKYQVGFTLRKRGVSLEAYPEDDSLFDSEGIVTDSEFNAFLEELCDVESWVDYDPRHSDAGLVVFAESKDDKAWYDSTGESAWVSC